MVELKAIKGYNDLVLKRKVVKGERFKATSKRAEFLLSVGVVTVLRMDKLKQKR